MYVYRHVLICDSIKNSVMVRLLSVGDALFVILLCVFDIAFGETLMLYNSFVCKVTVVWVCCATDCTGGVCSCY